MEKVKLVIKVKKVVVAKPILKWVGGKTQIIHNLLSQFPKEMENYREIFVGGGSVLLGVLSYMKGGIIRVKGKIYAYDLNDALIHMYINIQERPLELYEEIERLKKEWNESGEGEINRSPLSIEEAKKSKENYYYWVRSEYNKMSVLEKRSILGSARFIFLNKTCFRGVYRVGPRGFNVPYGNYTNPEIINKEHLLEISELLEGVRFICSDFRESLCDVEEKDFVYLDPPYAKETKKSFVGYTEEGFSMEFHMSLFGHIKEITDEGKRMMLSNADVSMVRENFGEDRYKIETIECKRSINSKNPESKTREVIIKNY